MSRNRHQILWFFKGLGNALADGDHTAHRHQQPARHQIDPAQGFGRFQHPAHAPDKARQQQVADQRHQKTRRTDNDHIQRRDLCQIKKSRQDAHVEQNCFGVAQDHRKSRDKACPTARGCGIPVDGLTGWR